MTEADWLDAVAAAAFVVRDQRVVFGNRAASALTGCPQSELAGMLLDDLLTESSSGARLKTRGGSISVEVSSAPVEYAGAPARLITALRHEQPDLYRAAVENGMDYFYLVQVQRRPDGRGVGVIIVDATERGVQHSRLPREKLIGASLTDLYPMLSYPDLVQGFVQVVTTGEPYDRELFLTDRIVSDGWYRVQLIPLDGDYVGVLLTDISARKESETIVQKLAGEVEQQARQLDEILSATPDTFILFDRAGRFRYVNRSGFENSGLIADQVVGKTWRELGFPEEVGVGFEQRLKQVFTTGKSINYEEKFPTQLGLRDYDTTLTPIHDKEGNVVSMLNTIRDITERKLAELEQKKLAEELEQQARVFDEVLSTTPDNFLMFDREGKFVYASPSALRYSSLTAQQVIGKTWRELGFPEEAGRNADELISRVLSTGEPTTIESVFPTVSGLRNFESIFSPLHDKTGQVVAVVITNRDITERKQTEEALRENQRLLRSIYETALAGIAVIDMDGFYVQVNKAFADLYGYSSDELVGKHLSTVLPPEIYEKTQETHERFMNGELPNAVSDARITRRDGQEIEISAYNNLLVRENGERLRVVFLLDMSEQRRAQRALQESELRLTSVLNSMEDAVWSLQADTYQLFYANPVIETLTGYSAADFAANQRLMLDIAHPDDRSRFAADLKQAGFDNTIDSEYRIFRRDGALRWVHNRFWGVNGVRGSRIDGIMTDITDRKRAEEQTMQLKFERERVHILSDFVRDASHEFRTPLSVIHTRLYLMEKINDPSRQQEYIDGIREQADRILKLVESLITMSRLDSLNELPLERLDLNRVLITMNAATTERAAREKTIRFALELPPETLYIRGEKDELITALNAIFDNAITYTPPNGTITVRAYPVNHTEVAIDVTDTGVGIGAAELPHIFERFYRVDSARSMRGFGLGLPIALKIVEMHDGRIEVESTPEQGSTFRLIFPADR